MSWHVHYRVELMRPLTEADLLQVRAHLERWCELMSSHCSGYVLQGRVGDRELTGSTQPSGDRRTANDLLTLVRALRELERELRGRAIIDDMHGEGPELEVRKLDLKSLGEELTEIWGDVDIGLDDDDEPGEVAGFDWVDDEPAPVDPQRPDSEAPDEDESSLEVTLRAAREAYAEWQRRKKSTTSG
jgi:hypothetical protein